MRDLKDKLLNSGATSAMVSFTSAPAAKAATDQQTSPSALFSGGSLANPFAAIFEEIREANKAGLSHAALALTLTIPDICAALISPKGKSNGDSYATWFDDHLGVYKGRLSGKDLYSIRSGILHEARSDRPHMQWERIVFDTKQGNHRGSIAGIAYNGVRMPDTFVVNVSRFSEEMIAAAEAWFLAHRENAHVVRNAAFVVRHRENVMAPAIGGISGIC
jgi:hypothetical protein